MKLTEAMVVWTPAGVGYPGEPFWETMGKIAVVPWPEEGPGRDYLKSSGACLGYVHDLSAAERDAWLFKLFHNVVVRDHLEPQATHTALLQIEEYASLFRDEEADQ